MARDLDLQYDGLIPAGGLHVDLGTIDFSNGSQTVEEDTTLLKVSFGVGIAQTKAAGNQTLVATTDGVVTNSKVTFRREGGFIAEDARYNYILVGT